MSETTRLYKNLATKFFRASNNEIIRDSRDKANKTVINLSKNNKS